MFKILLVVVIFSLIGCPGFAADVTLKWDPSEGATGYKLQKSIDLGVTWAPAVDVGNVTTYMYTGVEENVLVIFRASAYNAVGESIRSWSGAWFDSRKKPVLSPGGQGIQ
jgi:hypothetical protein